MRPTTSGCSLTVAVPTRRTAALAASKDGIEDLAGLVKDPKMTITCLLCANACARRPGAGREHVAFQPGYQP